ncbi:MAG: ATP-binding protein [Halohasta sp.]
MSYRTSHQHLLAELARIDAMLAACDPIETTDDDTVDGESFDDVATTTRQPRALPLAVSGDGRRRIDERCRATDRRLRLRVLREAFDLSRRHLDVLLLALAPRLDEKYHAVFQRLHNREAITAPTEILLETLFATSPAERLAAGGLVASESPLRRHDLVDRQPCPDPALGERGRLITVPDRIVEFLKGYDGVDPDLKATLADHASGHTAGIERADATATLDSVAVDDELRDRLAAVGTDDTDRHYWYGPASEKHRAVAAVCDADQYLKVDLAAVLAADGLDWLHREAALLGRPLHLYNATAATEPPDRPTLDSVFDALGDLDTPVVVTGSGSWTPTGTMSTSVDTIIEFPYPGVGLRREFWQRHAADLPDGVDPEVLAGTFRLTHEGLRAALSTARSVADDEPTADDIYRGCRAQSTGDLGELADRIQPDSEWDEIELRPDTEAKLRLVGTHIAQQGRIYDEWGFAERFSRGTGVVALFEGPSGTGKTMAAEILAGEVGMDLYRVDLSSVVSKYIGETEENLEAIFEAATNANAVLLFDEADAVFGERGEVSDSTDRYANAEVNYLLQRIERYDGVVLLTTNYASAIDSAFQRRLDHTVSFKKPQQSTRKTIWAGMFPDDAPMGDLDYDFLSEFEFTGGEIKQVAQTAAILAADEDRAGEPTIEMRHLVGAIRQATEASGRMVDPAAFEPYRGLLDDGPAADSDDDPPTEPQTDRSPEAVVEAFVDRLDAGDPAIHDLYHPRAVADPVSRKELRRAETVDHGIVDGIERRETADDRVVLTFTHRRNGSPHRMTAELRPEDGDWRLFDLQRQSDAADTTP